MILSLRAENPRWLPWTSVVQWPLPVLHLRLLAFPAHHLPDLGTWGFLTLFLCLEMLPLAHSYSQFKIALSVVSVLQMHPVLSFSPANAFWNYCV